MTTLEFKYASGLATASSSRRFESVVEELLRDQDLGQVRVRFIPSRTSDPGRYVCQVYAGPTGIFAGTPRWVWWSPFFTSAEELRRQLQNALRLRGQHRTRGDA
jgi:hypothetical protein